MGASMALPTFLRGKLRLPAVGAPLFIISHPALVIAQCKAGVVGAFPTLNARPISQLDEWLAEITETLAAYDRAHPHAPSAAHAWGGVVLHDVITDRFARKAIEKGADGLIPVAAGAGGHAGMLSPFAIVEEIRQWFDGPVALSGAIATGR